MTEKKKYRSVIFYKDYFESFFINQRKSVRNKILWTLELIEDIQKIPETYLKHIKNTDGLYEIRVQQGNDIFRIFCFFAQRRMIILMNGFQKKSQKTPQKEIEKALKIKQEYESSEK